jgi:hypothetical protein
MTTPFLVRRAVLAALAVAIAAEAPASLPETTFTSSTTPTTMHSVSTSSSILEDYDNDRMFGVFPSAPIATLKVRFEAYPDYGPEDASCRFYGPGSTGPYTAFDGETTFSFATLSKGELDRSQAIANCEFYTHEPHGSLGSGDIHASLVEARNSDGELVPTMFCLLDESDDNLPEPGTDDCRYGCGDAICDGGEPKVSDALAVLKRALGSYSCPLLRCDVNHDGEVTAADGLKVLRRAVQLRSVLLCLPKLFTDGECYFAGGEEWYPQEEP